MSAAEEVVETAEEVVEAIEGSGVGLSGVSLVVFGAVCGAVGGTVAYFVGKKVLESKYDELLKEEIAQTKAFYSNLNKRGEETPEKAVANRLPVAPVEKAADAILSYQGNNPADIVVAEPDDEPPVVEVNVFAQSVADPEFDVEAEMENRNPDEPYIISKEEFFANEDDYEQLQFTYYEGDHVLANEQDEEITYPDPIIGEDHLMHFGRGSGDPRIVYVRNEHLESDFEIVQHDGKYAHVVAGLQHSDGGSRGRRQSKELRKFRDSLD